MFFKIFCFLISWWYEGCSLKWSKNDKFCECKEDLRTGESFCSSSYYKKIILKVSMKSYKMTWSQQWDHKSLTKLNVQMVLLKNKPKLKILTCYFSQLAVEGFFHVPGMKCKRSRKLLKIRNLTGET